MNSISISKKEVVVLFDLLKLSDMPCSITNIPSITAKEYTTIARSFYDSKVVISSDTGLHIDKGVECFFVPIMLSTRVLLFNQGEDGICRLNLSVYFSKKGIVAVRETADDTIDFLCIDSIGELFLLLPEIEQLSKKAGTYISYWIFENDMGVAHCAVFELKSDVVNVINSKRQKDKAQCEETKTTMSVSQYYAFFKNKVKEIYNVFDC